MDKNEKAKSVVVTLRVSETKKAKWVSEAKQFGENLTQYLLRRLENASNPIVIDGANVASDLFKIALLLEKHPVSSESEITIRSMCDNVVETLHSLIFKEGNDGGSNNG